MVKQDSSAEQVFDVVHARILRFFPDAVAALGGDAGSLLRQAGIDVEALAAGGSAATYRQLVNLLELAAAALQCPDFGMRLATLQNGSGMFGPLGLVMQNSRTFGDALEYVGKHAYAHSLAARIWLRRSRAEKTVFVGHDILLDRMPNKSQALEQIFLAGHLAAAALTGGQARVREVHFRHQPVSPLRIYRRYFRCEVCFGQNEDGVVYFERDLACPIVDPDARAYQSATSFIDSSFPRHLPPLHAQVRGVIMRFLGTEHCTTEWIASELNIHPRTLHRRLKVEDTSFQQIKDEVRRDLMHYYLQHTELKFTEISEKLGFAEQSVFTRSCNRWFSTSPTKVRSQAYPPDLAG
ncbi:MAG TPA: AraC family transcriptional regulator ligand-binding domain-containing protein [Acetobacteraceae bacterium]|nr:AraC family transcriptional regulator ligand-binding domain-containing protein [Acetobacteraceae bacterium]